MMMMMRRRRRRRRRMKIKKVKPSLYQAMEARKIVRC
jgi:hypothetical protein